MKRTKFNVLALAAALTLGGVAQLHTVQPAEAFPQPNPYPIAWEFDFRPDEPRRIVVEVPGREVPTAFWYMTYSVENNTGRERPFYPTFELALSDGRVIRSDRGVPQAAFEAIQRRTGETELEDVRDMALSPLLMGPDQRRRGVAIWEEPMPELGRFTVFVGGLSGEATQMEGLDGQPLTDADGNPVLLFKTKQLNYRLLGDELYAGTDRLQYEGERWVMR
jgi:hypothetical protein